VRTLLVAAAALLLSACPSPQTAGGGATGARSSRAAVEAFLDAARAGDIQALTAVWGTERGAARDRLPPDQLEKQAVIMACHFRSDAYEIQSERAADNNERVTRVELRKGSLRRTTTFNTVEGPAERWYVSNADIVAVQDIAKQEPACAVR
jgi:hypothetical protein